MDWSRFPKVELHLHLDCSLSYGVASRLDPSLTLQEYRASFIAPAKCTDLADALTRASAGVARMQTEEQLRLVTLDLFEQLRRDRVIYAEIRFAPLLHLEQGLSSRQVVACVDAATAEAVRNTGIEARLILCTLRHYTEAQSLETVHMVEAFRDSYVAGFDLAADEAGFRTGAHRAAFQYARERRIPCTAHAGEALGPDGVWDALDQLAPSRIGHGVRSIEDPALLDHLRKREIHLEVCPTCNVMIDVYDTYADHPLDALYQAGLSVGVNTDARTMADITLNEEYGRIEQTFGWGVDDFHACNRNALQAAFLPPGVKDRLLAQLAEGYQHAV